MLRSVCIGSNKRQVNFAVCHGRKLDLGFFGGFTQTLQGHSVLGKVDARIVFKLVHKPCYDAVIEVITAQMRIAVCGLDLEHTVAEFQNGNIEGTAAQVVYGDGFFFFGILVKTEGQRSRRRFIYNALYVQTSNLARILGRLPLGVVKIRGNGYNRLAYRFAQIIFSRFFHFL